MHLATDNRDLRVLLPRKWQLRLLRRYGAYHAAYEYAHVSRSNIILRNDFTQGEKAAMLKHSSVFQSAIMEAVFLATIFLSVHALVLTFIFPGFYDPFWPHHSDFYIAQALAHAEGGFLQIVSEPRPLALLLFSQFGKLGIQGAVFASFAVVVTNYVGICMIVQRAFKLPINSSLILAAAGFAYLLTSHPYQYGYSTWDLFSQLSFLALILASHFLLQKHAPWKVFALALFGFLIKETYAASAFALALYWLFFNLNASKRYAIRPLAITILAFVTAFTINRLNGSLFTGGADFVGSPYHIVLNPGSVVARQLSWPVRVNYLGRLTLGNLLS